AQLTRPAQPAHSSASAGTGQGRRPRRSASLKVLGDAESASRRPVALAPADARHHLHVMGATGSGKSTLLVNLILGDIEAGRGAVVIDPKGDLVTDLCDRLPAGAETKTVLIDPAERDAPPVLNVLAGPDPDLVVDNLVGIFRNIFAAYWGPRTDDVLRAACLTLPSGSVVAGSFAAGVLSAVALGRLRRRHAYRYRPPEPGRNLGPGPLRPTLRHLGVAAMTTNGHRPPGPGEVPAMADDDPEHRERPDLVEIGTHDGQPVTLALSELAGVTVVGTTAAQMVAAWVTALMARAGPRAAEVLATRPALDVMFGPGGCPETVPGLWVLDNPGRVLGLLERTALTRARQLAEAEMPDVVAYRQANPWEPVPMVLAIVDHLPDGDAGRWGATTTKGPRLGFVAVSLDPNAPMPGRLTVGEDRVVTAAVPDWLAGRLVGVELFGLTAGDAADVIATLAESEERPDSTDGDTDDFMTADREDPGETAWPTLTAAPEDRREAPSASTEAAETGPVEPDGPDVASVVVTVFGPYEIAVDGEVVSRGLRTVAKELLAWLCLRPEGASVEAAVDALWPDTERAQVHKAFWLAASNLRTRLGATGETDSKVLVQSGDVYRLDPAAVDCDLWAFQQALAAAARAEGDRPARDALRRAVDAYRGDLLVGTDYAWVEPVRQDLHRRALDAHLRLAELDARLGNPDSATDTLRRAIDLDRYAEEPYRRLMALQADQGRLDALADTWRRLNDRLAEIDVDPEPATEHLYHSLTHPPETPADRARRARLSS
nr:BTAD domain-containing putative transcriptional regulator [Actinomycetota bacterium]